MEQFRQRLMRESQQVEDFEKRLSEAVFIIEKELHQYITEEYPLMKFYSQLENLKEFLDKQEEEYNKAETKAKTMK